MIGIVTGSGVFFYRLHVDLISRSFITSLLPAYTSFKVSRDNEELFSWTLDFARSRPHWIGAEITHPANIDTQTRLMEEYLFSLSLGLDSLLVLVYNCSVLCHVFVHFMGTPGRAAAAFAVGMGILIN